MRVKDEYGFHDRGGPVGAAPESPQASPALERHADRSAGTLVRLARPASDPGFGERVDDAVIAGTRVRYRRRERAGQRRQGVHQRGLVV